MSENRINATINGRMYTLVSEESEEYMNRIADCVNEQVSEVKKKNPTLFGERPIVLAALNICDKYLKADQGTKVLIDKTQKKYNELVEENKRLNEILKNSDYEIDVASLRHRLDNANMEIAELKEKLKGK